MLAVVDLAARELILFAAVGLLLGGLDDLAVDLIYFARRAWRAMTVYRRFPRATAAGLADQPAGRIAVFVGAWDEGGVIGQMLATARARWGDADYCIYVGTYPNDAATNAEISGGFAGDRRVRIVPGARPGPTSKAEALNRCWRALLDDEAADGAPTHAVAIHDAEDVVHRHELRIFRALVGRFDLVQLPVLPLAHRRGWLIAGHYADEFAEAHAKQLVVREAIGAGLPAAGTGCAIARDTLGRIAAANGGRPFDDTCYTEDYEIGLRLHEAGGRGVFVRLAGADGGAPVAVRAHFPESFQAAVRQKARWIEGIALAGWDRLGWRGGWAERWMRLRDRRAPLAALVLAAGYAGLLIGAAAAGGHAMLGDAVPPLWRWDAPGAALAALFAWRLAMRALFVTRTYGWREGLLSLVRLPVANAILIAAAWRAWRRYFAAEAAGWDKTAHVFPTVLPAE